MTGEQLFESLQYLDDTLLTAPVRRAAPRRRWPIWAAAACLALAVGAAGLLHAPRITCEGMAPPDAPSIDGGQALCTTMPPDTQCGLPGPDMAAGAAETMRPIQPVGVPGPEAAPDASPVPDVLAWNDIDEARAAERLGADVAGVMMVAEPLTEEQRAACSPEIRLEWMGSLNGFAGYYLKDGAGGLAYIEMKAAHDGAGEYTVRIRDVNMPEPPGCLCTVRETDRAGSLNGQAYRAYRYSYYHGEGDPGESPPEAWSELQVVFEKENVAFTLTAAVPQALEDAAASDLRDLLLAYVGSHSVPDLSAFRCGEYLYRDDQLTLSEALADPEFGAWLPVEGPEGFDFDFSRRYQFEETENYLMVFWTCGDADLQWLVRPVTEEAETRVVAPDEPERYDWNLYPVPWSAYAARENRATVENPVFRIGDLTMELVNARVHAGDEGMAMFRFGVLYDSGVLVEVNAKGVSAEWVYQALTQLG